MNWILQSERLGLRKLCPGDFDDVCAILQDPSVMYAWEHGFTKQEVQEWIEENLSRYAAEGFSFFAAVEKDSGFLIGVMGPLIEQIDGDPHMGIAYILNKEFWGKGYATEGAGACMEYAFDRLGAEKVIAEIRPENAASCKVAERLGMEVEGQFVKNYQEREMLHLIYSKIK